MEQVMEGVMVGKRTEEEKCKVIMGNLDSKSNDSNPIVACIKKKKSLIAVWKYGSQL